MLGLDVYLNVSKFYKDNNEYCSALLHLMYFLQGLCNNSDLRLVGGSTEREGRIEICFNETWGTVCDSLWTSNDANVACGQLGFSRIGT